MVPESEEIHDAQQSVWNRVVAPWTHTAWTSRPVAYSWETAGKRAHLLPVENYSESNVCETQLLKWKENSDDVKSSWQLSFSNK